MNQRVPNIRWGRAEGIYFILTLFLLTTIEKVDGGRLVARSRADTPPTHGTTERDRTTAIAVTRGSKPNAGPERVRWGRAKKVILSFYCRCILLTTTIQTKNRIHHLRRSPNGERRKGWGGHESPGRAPPNAAGRGRPGDHGVNGGEE